MTIIWWVRLSPWNWSKLAVGQSNRNQVPTSFSDLFCNLTNFPFGSHSMISTFPTADDSVLSWTTVSCSAGLLRLVPLLEPPVDWERCCPIPAGDKFNLEIEHQIIKVYLKKSTWNLWEIWRIVIRLHLLKHQMRLHLITHKHTLIDRK